MQYVSIIQTSKQNFTKYWSIDNHQFRNPTVPIRIFSIFGNFNIFYFLFLHVPVMYVVAELN
jgi:hypothetical protein